MAKIDKNEMEFAAEEWIRCSLNKEYFIRNYCKLKDQKKGSPEPFKLWDSQVNQLQIWQDNRFAITLKSRQIGISWLSAADDLHDLMFNNLFVSMVVSKKESAAIGYLNKVKFFYNHLPELFKLMCPLHCKPTLLSLKFTDTKTGHEGSSITAESANPEAGRCETLNSLTLDEAAFIPDASRIWTAAEPTLEQTNGKAKIISTANGYDAFFQPKYEAAEMNINGFKPNFISWQGDPKRDKQWFDNKMRVAVAENKIREFKQEFPSTAIEAWIVSGNTFFDPDMIESYCNTKFPIPRKGNLKTRVNEIGQKVCYLDKNTNGFLNIWEFPTPDTMYVAGIDSAEGNEFGDLSVMAIYNKDTGKQVAEYSGRIDTDRFAKDIYMIGKYYNFALLNPETNNIGDSLMNYLVKKMHYPNIYRQMRYDERSGKRIKKLGWRTTSSSKRTMLDALGMLLRERVMMPYSTVLFSEMKHFMINETKSGNYTYEASKGHDDHVIAHSLAAIALQDSNKPHVERRDVVPQLPRKRVAKARKSNNLRKLLGKIMN